MVITRLGDARARLDGAMTRFSTIITGTCDSHLYHTN